MMPPPSIFLTICVTTPSPQFNRHFLPFLRPQSSSMDRHSSKRSRSDQSSSSSPPEIANREKRICSGGDRGDGRLLDLDLSFGVFDFPWLKESLINSKSEDWKFEDSFDIGVISVVDAAFAIDHTELSSSGQLVWCNLPDPWAVDAAVPPLDGGGGTAGEGMDCVWRSLLNQPLHQRSSCSTTAL